MVVLCPVATATILIDQSLMLVGCLFLFEVFFLKADCAMTFDTRSFSPSVTCF